MSDTKLEKVLIIDDNSDYRKLIKTFISKLLPSVETIEYDPVAEGAPGDDFNWSEIDVLLLDYNLAIVGTTGLDILHKHHKKPSFPATVMLTGAGTEEIAVRALKTGIYEYQSKQALTKDKLKQVIILAWEDKISSRKKRQEITQHNKSFSKEVFYENLENALARKETDRALLVIKPDNIDDLEQLIGVIGRDSLINFIGKNSFEVFKLGACNPNITRISDTAIAIQIDIPETEETLEFNMQGLCKHLTHCTFKFSEDKYSFSVSIGLIKLGVIDTSAAQLIRLASAAAKKAHSIEGNSYYIWKETDSLLPEPAKPVHIKTDDPSRQAFNAEKEKLQQELKAAEAVIQAEHEANNKLEAELKLASEAKEKAEAALKLASEAKEKAEAEAKAQAELEAKEKAEAEAKAQAELEAKEKAEAEINIVKETKERLEAELKAMAEAKLKAELEMKAAKEAKEKLEAELKALSEVKTQSSTMKADNVASASEVDVEKTSTDSSIQTTEPSSADIEEQNNNGDANDPSRLSTEEIELRIKELIDEKRIIQTYQPVMPMFDDDSEINLYKTGLKAIIDNEDELNANLADLSLFSFSLQQTINEWSLRQVFLRITEAASATSKNNFIITVNEAWFTDISLFNWLQKILSQTKKYAPGESIILDIPIDLYKKHQKRAKALIDTLHKSHDFRVCLSNIIAFDCLASDCELTQSGMLSLHVNNLSQLTEILSPSKNETEENKDETEKRNLLQYLESTGIRIIAYGIEDSTLLTDAITNGTDYAMGSFIGDVQNSLLESGTVESFDLT
jgi:DNA-binding response OmpR family regulator